MPTPSLYPPLHNVLASQSGSPSPGTIVAAGIDVSLGDDALEVDTVDASISVTVFPETIIADGS